MIDKMIEEMKELSWQAEKDMGLSESVEEANYYGGLNDAYEKSIAIAEKYKLQEFDEELHEKPMHFTPEQTAWIKQYVIKRCEYAREEERKSQEQKWISVEERLPEDDANVLAFIKYVMVDGTCVGEENTMCDVTWYNPSSKRWFLPGLKEAEVIAWCPIPKHHFAETDKKVGGDE